MDRRMPSLYPQLGIVLRCEMPHLVIYLPLFIVCFWLLIFYSQTLWQYHLWLLLIYSR